MELASKRKTDTRNLVRAGILSALIIVMTIVPYTGYIYYGLIEITTLHIVVAVGAVLLGWEYGAVLGLVWPLLPGRNKGGGVDRGGEGPA